MISSSRKLQKIEVQEPQDIYLVSVRANSEIKQRKKKGDRSNNFSFQIKKECLTPNRPNNRNIFNINYATKTIRYEAVERKSKQIDQKMLIEEEASDKELSRSPSHLQETRRSALDLGANNRKQIQSIFDQNDFQ